MPKSHPWHTVTMRKITKSSLLALLAAALIVPIASPAQGAKLKNPAQNLKGNGHSR